ncbi:arsenate reductase family protein [uncultured Christiangramia sp.]|uniref:arsenate reductase family protein n=1 Tax=uncultured Christiangramia sp. TaxID=503836 RepID=UPI0026381B56|nr:ArsC/Spx/MgsR family protein [uncultured Christiangramia sp.]
MKKVYHLSTCDTCKRILKELDLPDDFELQDIKTEAISKVQLEEMHLLAGSYESLFNKRARLYKERDLKNKSLEESDYKELILEHYTFLKRPVVINGDKIFIGNSKKTVEAAKSSVHG